MGDMADYYAHYDHEPDKEEDFDVWVAKDGERISIVEMTDSHLMNAIRYLRRRMIEGWPESCRLEWLEREAEDRGLRVE